MGFGADDEAEGSGAPRRKKVRDLFAEAMGPRIAPIAFSAPAKTQTYDQQITDMARTMETSN